jgi:CRISPR-associated endonuclease/helicase Cas3
MQGEPTDFWGKLQGQAEGGGPCEWHPLIDHCADVAAVTETLLDLPLWRDRLSRLAGGDLDAVMRARLGVLAALHDVGKFNIGFQAKGRPDLGPTAGHVTEAVAALGHPPIAVLGEIEQWGDWAVDLLIAAICHHGRPIRVEAAAASWQRSWWAPRAGLDPTDGIRRLFARCRGWFPAAFEPARGPGVAPEFTHAFAGLVMLADWIASDDELFPFATDGMCDRMPQAREFAAKSARSLSLFIPQDHRRDSKGRGPFARIAPAGLDARPAQRAMLDLPLDRHGSITVLEAETGSGKTEAALSRFVVLFEAGLVDGLYFALPTRTAATQLYRRVCKAVGQAFDVPPPVVLAVPGYLDVDGQQGRRLAPFEVQWPDHDRLRYRGWAAENSKRYLAASIAVGTIDQVLLSTLMVGHAHLRATALLRQLLVVDEVHASDVYMGRLLRHVLARHLAAGGHALLLSATLGGEARRRLLHPGDAEVETSLDDASATPYPSLTTRADGMMQAGIDNGAPEREVHVVVERWMDDVQTVSGVAWAAARAGAKVLVVRNTVADCLDTQRALETVAGPDDDRLLFSCEGAPAPHHARFAREDREALDCALEARFGKERPDGGGIVVATHTVQQSLDIDADVLFTDLCPIDVLLQRIGRVHRHERGRPKGFGRPRAVVLVPAERDLGRLIGQSGAARGPHGLGTVYEDLRILEATWRVLDAGPIWQIPRMNRYLVERGVHSAALSAVVSELGPPWLKHAEFVTGRRFGQARFADLNIVDWAAPYGECGFPDRLEQHISTRLGEGDRRAVFAAPVTGPFRRPIQEMRIPARWAVDVPQDCYLAEDVSADQGRVFFTLGSRRFVYDRLGLRPESAGDRRTEQEDAHDDGP